MKRRMNEIAGCLGQKLRYPIADTAPKEGQVIYGPDESQLRHTLSSYDATTGANPMGRMLLPEETLGIADAYFLATKINSTLAEQI